MWNNIFRFLCSKKPTLNSLKSEAVANLDIETTSHAANMLRFGWCYAGEKRHKVFSLDVYIVNVLVSWCGLKRIASSVYWEVIKLCMTSEE